MQWRVLQKLRTAPFDPGVRSVAQPRMEFLNEAAFPETGFADDEHQLPIALPGAAPAPHQRANFFVTPNQWCEMSLTSAASAPTGSHMLEQRHRL